MTQRQIVSDRLEWGGGLVRCTTVARSPGHQTATAAVPLTVGAHTQTASALAKTPWTCVDQKLWY